MICLFPDTYVKLTLMSPNGQEITRSKTSIRRGQPHPLFKETPPTIADHTASRDGDTVTVAVTLAPGAATKGVWVAHRAAGHGGFTYSPLSAEADGNYAVTLPAEQTEQYFLVAEGNISATVLPARSAREWFVVE